MNPRSSNKWERKMQSGGSGDTLAKKVLKYSPSTESFQASHIRWPMVHPGWNLGGLKVIPGKCKVPTSRKDLINSLGYFWTKVPFGVVDKSLML